MIEVTDQVAPLPAGREDHQRQHTVAADLPFEVRLTAASAVVGAGHRIALLHFHVQDSEGGKLRFESQGITLLELPTRESPRAGHFGQAKTRLDGAAVETWQLLHRHTLGHITRGQGDDEGNYREVADLHVGSCAGLMGIESAGSAPVPPGSPGGCGVDSNPPPF